MSQDESKKGIHWPSLFWVCIGILNFTLGISESRPSYFFLGLGFFCMAYSSKSLVPADLFTKDISFKIEVKKSYGKAAGIIQFIGFVFMVLGLAVSLIYT
ncbi:MAG: hypothetical protein OCD00_05770 [Colwellia sp.]